MPYSLSLIVILTSVLTGPWLVDVAGKSNPTYSGLRRLFQSMKCAPGSNESQLKKFHDCYNKSAKTSDSKGCEAGSEDIHDKCLKFLDREKIGDTKGLTAICKANGDSDEDKRRMKELTRCVLETRVRLCPKSDLDKEYRKWLAHGVSAQVCVKKR